MLAMACPRLIQTLVCTAQVSDHCLYGEQAGRNSIAPFPDVQLVGSLHATHYVLYLFQCFMTQAPAAKSCETGHDANGALALLAASCTRKT